MTNELKQRLVGATVITALAAIFLPMLFDDPVKESSQVVNELSIPTPPQITPPTLAYPSEAQPETSESVVTKTDQAVETTPVEDFPSSQPLDQIEPEEKETSTAAEKNALIRMTVEELAAKKDKKEREKILKEQLTETESEVNVAQTPVFIEEKPKVTIINDKKPKEKTFEKVDAEKKVKLKQETEKKVTEKLNKEKLLGDKKTAEKAEKDKLAADKKANEKLAKEKQLSDKKIAEKIANEIKIAVKQQIENDKVAAAKIAADKLAAKKAPSNTPIAASRWFVRVGSFGVEANANALRDSLRKQGYPANVDVVKVAGKKALYRLRVGPQLSKPQAEKIRQKMDTENGSKSFLEIE